MCCSLTDLGTCARRSEACGPSGSCTQTIPPCCGRSGRSRRCSPGTRRCLRGENTQSQRGFEGAEENTFTPADPDCALCCAAACSGDQWGTVGPGEVLLVLKRTKAATCKKPTLQTCQCLCGETNNPGRHLSHWARFWVPGTPTASQRRLSQHQLGRCSAGARLCICVCSGWLNPRGPTVCALACFPPLVPDAPLLQRRCRRAADETPLAPGQGRRNRSNKNDKHSLHVLALLWIFPTFFLFLKSLLCGTV